MGGGDPGNEPAAPLRHRRRQGAVHAEGQHRARHQDAAPASSKAPPTKRSSTKATAPAASPSLVEILTDNRNRTAAEVRKIFERSGGNLGGAGCVAWLFDRKGVMLVDAGDRPTRTR